MIIIKTYLPQPSTSQAYGRYSQNSVNKLVLRQLGSLYLSGMRAHMLGEFWLSSKRFGTVMKWTCKWLFIFFFKPTRICSLSKENKRIEWSEELSRTHINRYQKIFTQHLWPQKPHCRSHRSRLQFLNPLHLRLQAELNVNKNKGQLGFFSLHLCSWFLQWRICRLVYEATRLLLKMENCVPSSFKCPPEDEET